MAIPTAHEIIPVVSDTNGPSPNLPHNTNAKY